MNNQRRSWRGLGLVALLASFCFAVVGVNPADAQKGQGKYVAQASESLVKLIAQANSDGYSLHSDKFSIGGGWIKQGEDHWVSLYTLNLTAGKKYRFLGAGDFDAKDVDIDIKNGAGDVVAKDVSTASTAVVDYSPNTSGKYLVRVRLYASEKNRPCMCLVVAMVK